MFFLLGKSASIFANDIQRLFDATQRVVSLRQTNHDIISHVEKARVVVRDGK